MVRSWMLLLVVLVSAAFAGEASAAVSDCGKRVCVEIRENLNHAYLEVMDFESDWTESLIVPVEQVEEARLPRGRTKGESSCDMSAQAPSTTGAVDGDGESVAVTCSYKLPDGSYYVVTTTFTWEYDGRTGQWVLIGVNSTAKIVKKPANQEK